MHAGGPGVRNGRPERLDILLRRGGQHRLQRLLAHTPQLTRRLAGDVAAPGRLNGDGDLCLHLEPARAQALEHARGEEDARLAAAELLAGHAELLEQRQHAVLGRLARELRLGAETGNHEEVAAKLVKGHAVGESGAGDTQRVEHARRVELARDDGVLDQVGLLLVVGLEAAHEVQVALVERADEVRELRREGVGDALELGRLELLPVARRGRHVRRLGEELLEQLVVGELHQHDQVLRERVLVLLEEAGRLVGHLARVVRDGEGGAVEPLLREVGVPRVLALDLLQPRGVRAGREEALLGEQREDAGGWLVDELDEQLVVLIRDVAHVDALLLVLGQYRLEDGLRKHLLQLLVCEVDAELLERVVRKVLKAEDVEESDVRQRRGRLVAGDEGVDLLHDPVEEVRVDGLDHRVAHGPRLLRRVGDRVDGAAAVGLLLALHHLARQVLGEGAAREQLLGRLAKVALAELLVEDGLVVCVVGELDVAKQQQRREHAEELRLLLLRDAERVHRLDRLRIVLGVALALELDALGLVEHVQVRRLEAGQERALVLGGARGAELVKDVVVSLRVGDGHRSRLFEQVRLDVGARHRAARLKVEAHHLAEAGRVVVAHRLCVSEGLEERVGAEDGVGERVELPLRLLAHRLGAPSQVAHDVLGRLRLAGAGLARHDDGRRRLVPLHVLVRRLAHRIHVRLGAARADVLVLVLCHRLLAVDG
mmetsp:Transcript_31658/g.93122  ORF Transcript_31658/g.93122 Transcript_31658/m.93122 type:complete len:713 (+) Transcript_31658:1590-3728(+)